jgi:hypothetical protein
MAPTSETTVPEPDPAFVTVRVYATAKVAVTLRAALIVTVHVAAPEQSPDQPVKTDPAEADAVSVTTVPSLIAEEHVAPQLIPPTSDVTVPVPVPAFVTVSVCGTPKVASTSRAWVIVTTHVVLLPEQSPLQPTKFEPEPAAAVSVTTVPSASDAPQVEPQLIPPTSDVTVPVPDPPVATFSG